MGNRILGKKCSQECPRDQQLRGHEAVSQSRGRLNSGVPVNKVSLKQQGGQSWPGPSKFFQPWRKGRPLFPSVNQSLDMALSGEGGTISGKTVLFSPEKGLNGELSAANIPGS